MTWFARDHTGRSLSDREHIFLAELACMLDEVRPPQLASDETALTAEGPGRLIVLMPHRALGGVSVVVWLDTRGAAVTWAQVGGLACCHDSLDAGLWIAGFQIDGSGGGFAPVIDCVREQFARPITLRLYGHRTYATVLVHNAKGRLRTVGELGQDVPWFRRLWRTAPGHQTEVRFLDDAQPPMSQPSGAAEWFEKGH